MRHLIISRELPPATYAAGGIGAYVANIARLLAEAGDTVHLIGERWDGAPEKRQVLLDGRLIVHRIGAQDVPDLDLENAGRASAELQGLRRTAFPNQWFSWSAAFLAEHLVGQEGIDVIEAQEWEAPLYYFLLRRSLGLGPSRQPPCIVHIHSPSVVIHHFNGRAAMPPALPALGRMEEFCIQSADALLCPSRSLASDAARRFRLSADAVEVIPLPVGFAAPLSRDNSVWTEGSICYVGRLEPRKGVIEWVEAATRVAREDPRVHFDFVGADIWDLRTALQAQIGKELASRFRFHGAKSKAEIASFLGRAMAAVVPSRWENFPNVCIEAMASGLPVIATRQGGMVEMLEDGRTGWLAEESGVAGMADSLAQALRRCLATSADQRSRMGAAAAEAIRRFCNNDVVVAAHRKLRAAVASRGPIRSCAATAATPIRPSANVVVRAESAAAARDVLRSLRSQTAPPKVVTLVYRSAAPAAELEDLAFGVGVQFHLERAPQHVGTQAWNHGFSRVATRHAEDFWLFLDEQDLLEPDCLQQMASVFARRPDVGVISPWTDRTGPNGYFDARPSPALLYQMTGNDVAPASGFRAGALDQARPFKPGLPREHDVWALANEVIARGWAAVTLPALVARRDSGREELSGIKSTALRAIRAEALAPFNCEEHRFTLQLIDAYVPLTQALHDNGRRRRLLRILEAIVLRPGYVLRRTLALIPGLSPRGALRS